MAQPYNRLTFILGTGIDLASADIRVALVTSAYAFDKDHDFVTSIAAAELSGGGYVRRALAGRTWTLDDATDRSVLDAPDLTWPLLLASAGTPAAAVLFLQVTNDADSPLLELHDLTPNSPPGGGDYVVQWGAQGILETR